MGGLSFMLGTGRAGGNGECGGEGVDEGICDECESRRVSEFSKTAPA
jgi:hypothetical protein